MADGGSEVRVAVTKAGEFAAQLKKKQSKGTNINNIVRIDTW